MLRARVDFSVITGRADDLVHPASSSLLRLPLMRGAPQAASTASLVSTRCRAADVVDIRTHAAAAHLRRECCGCPAEVPSTSAPSMISADPAHGSELTCDSFRLGPSQLCFQNDQLALRLLRRQAVFSASLRDLLGQLIRVAAHNGTDDLATTAQVWPCRHLHAHAVPFGDTASLVVP